MDDLVLMRGRVIRKDENGFPWVEVPDLGVGQEFGPCEMIAHPNLVVAGEPVVVASLGGIVEDLVVVGPMTSGVDAESQVTQAELQAALEPYVTALELTAALGNYVTNGSLLGTLADYVSAAELAAMGYRTEGQVASQIDTALLPYVTESEVDAKIAAAYPDQEEEFLFTTPSPVWTVNHGWGSYALTVSTFDSLGEIEGEIDYADENTVSVRWYTPKTGRMVLRK